MIQYLPYIFIAAVAAAVAFCLTPFLSWLGERQGLLDRPGVRSDRTVHLSPVPRLGGIAIFAGFAIAVAIWLGLESPVVRGTLVGGFLIMLLGLIDDLRPMSAKVKFLFQLAAALVLVLYGVKIEWLTNPLGGYIYLGNWGLPLTIFWVVAMVNVVNLIDGLDGLAAGVSSIAALTLLFVALQEGQTTVVFLSAALAGATLGFLPFNFNPARIFMGDSGALFLGYVLAAVSIEGAIKSAAAVGLAVPVLALGLPIADTFFAIMRRSRNGRPVYRADKGHLHHRLLALGLNHRQTVVIMYCISGFLGMSAIALSEVQALYALGLIAALMVGMYVGGKRVGVLDHPEVSATAEDASRTEAAKISSTSSE